MHSKGIHLLPVLSMSNDCRLTSQLVGQLLGAHLFSLLLFSKTILLRVFVKVLSRQEARKQLVRFIYFIILPYFWKFKTDTHSFIKPSKSNFQHAINACSTNKSIFPP